MKSPRFSVFEIPSPDSGSRTATLPGAQQLPVTEAFWSHPPRILSPSTFHSEWDFTPSPHLVTQNIQPLNKPAVGSLWLTLSNQASATPPAAEWPLLNRRRLKAILEKKKNLTQSNAKASTELEEGPPITEMQTRAAWQPKPLAGSKSLNVQ